MYTSLCTENQKRMYMAANNSDIICGPVMGNCLQQVRCWKPSFWLRNSDCKECY